MTDRSLDIDTWLDQYLDYLAGDRATVPSVGDLAPGDQAEAKRRALAVGELWGREAAPSTGAPSAVAQALGFDQIDRKVSIAGPRLKPARQAANLTVSGLSRRLAELGWLVSAAELGELETGRRLDVPGEAIPLLAAVLGVDATDLVATDPAPVEQLLALKRVQAAIETTAVRLGRTVDDVASFLRPQLAGAQYRRHDSQEDDLIELVTAILEGME